MDVIRIHTHTCNVPKSYWSLSWGVCSALLATRQGLARWTWLHSKWRRRPQSPCRAPSTGRQTTRWSTCPLSYHWNNKQVQMYKQSIIIFACDLSQKHVLLFLSIFSQVVHDYVTRMATWCHSLARGRPHWRRRHHRPPPLHRRRHQRRHRRHRHLRHRQCVLVWEQEASHQRSEHAIFHGLYWRQATAPTDVWWTHSECFNDQKLIQEYNTHIMRPSKSAMRRWALVRCRLVWWTRSEHNETA